MDEEIRRQLLIAAATRQGVPITPVEAETMLDTLSKDGITIVIEADWTIRAREENEHDFWTADMRDLVEMAVEYNEQEIMDKSGDYSFSDPVMMSLYKDSYILEAVQKRTEDVIPPKLNPYKVGIVISHKIYDTIKASCWSEAESIVKINWANGKYSFSDKDFRGIFVTNG